MELFSLWLFVLCPTGVFILLPFILSYFTGRDYTKRFSNGCCIGKDKRKGMGEFEGKLSWVAEAYKDDKIFLTIDGEDYQVEYEFYDADGTHEYPRIVFEIPASGHYTLTSFRKNGIPIIYQHHSFHVHSYYTMIMTIVTEE